MLNAKRLTEICSGEAALTVEEANVAGRIARDTREACTLSPQGAVDSALSNELLQRNKAGKESQKVRCANARKRVAEASMLPTSGAAFKTKVDAATGNSYYWQDGSTKVSWTLPKGAVVTPHTE
jgi:hypothetical protein